jgi:hypothetical protein
MATHTAPLTVVTDSEIALDPSWDRARALWADAQKAWSARAQFVSEIERLRAEFLGQGHGGNRKNQVSQVVKLDRTDGFVAQLRAQLGLHPQEAARLIQSAARVHFLQACSQAEPGDEIALPATTNKKPGDDAETHVTITFELRGKAADLLAELEKGEATPGRAYTGFRGFQKTAKSAGTTKRAEVNHARNIARGLTALQTSLPHWDELDTDTRAALEKGWALIVDLIPSTFAR